MSRVSPPEFRELLGHLYQREQAEVYSERLVALTTEYRAKREDAPERWDEDGRGDPEWFKSHQLVAYSLYADRFAPTSAGQLPLQRLGGELDYLTDLGVNLLHVLPFLLLQRVLLPP
jgi:hypothetical protein